MEKIYIYLENGLFLEANSFGASGTKTGKLVFNNSTFGYEDVITDPSNAGLFVNFTSVEIGSTGINSDDMESTKAQISGVIVRNYHDEYSNYRAQKSLSQFLKEENALGICDIDTRYLTKVLRDEGSQMMVASTQISSKDELAKVLKDAQKYEEINFIKDSSTQVKYIHKSGIWDMDANAYKKASMSDKKVAVLDFGVKKTFLNELVNANLEVEVYPYNTNASELISMFENDEIGAVVLTDGAGNPNIYKDEIEAIKALIKANIPLFAIGLGHQLLALANGVEVSKLENLKQGSHPILGEVNVEIYTVNSDYVVDSKIEDFASVEYQTLFTNSAMGLKYNNIKAISVGFNPPSNSIIYKEFAELVK